MQLYMQYNYLNAHIYFQKWVKFFYVICLKKPKKTYIKLMVSYFLKHDEEDL